MRTPNGRRTLLPPPETPHPTGRRPIGARNLPRRRPMAPARIGRATARSGGVGGRVYIYSTRANPGESGGAVNLLRYLGRPDYARRAGIPPRV